MKYDNLKLKNQLCHPLYSIANAVIRGYEPHLKKLDLTYAQYLVMLSLWEQDDVAISKISETTYFDSGSLTPLIKRLKDKGYISVTSSEEDLREKKISLTKKGEKLKDKALEIIPGLAACFSSISLDEAMTLKKILNKLVEGLI